MRYSMATGLAFALVMFAGCASLVRAEDDARTFLGPTAVKVLEGPTKIEVWRISGFGAREKATPPVAVDVGLAKDLAKILLDEKTYSFDSAKACEFQPGVGIRVWRDNASIDVILCFHCTELKIVTPDPASKKFPYKVEDFDHARPAMVTLVKAAFPGDKEIQGLK